jgi:cobalamin biosynthesis protein CobW
LISESLLSGERFEQRLGLLEVSGVKTFGEPVESGLLTHEHVHAEDPGWLSFILRSQTSQTPDTLHKALDRIAAQEPVLCIKGFAHVRDAAGHLLVQGLRTRIACTMETAAPSQHDGQHRTKLSEQTETAWY